MISDIIPDEGIS